MALNLRKSVIRNGVITAVLCLVLSVALTMLAGGMDINPVNLAWPLVLALGIGTFTAWQAMAKIKQGVMQSLPLEFSYTRVSRDSPLNGIKIDWEPIDDHGIQLETRGYTCLGEFTTYPLPKHFVGVAACFVDRTTSTLVEVQYIQMNKVLPAGVPANAGGVHVSVMSALGGNITASTTDHKVMASNYLIRGSHNAVASFPGMGLMQLLEKHTRLVAQLGGRSGKKPFAGLDMNRYILLQRERFAQARKRLQRMSGYAIAKQIDAFEAAPRTNWATSSARLANLPERPFTELDSSEYAAGQPTILNLEADNIAAAQPGVSNAHGPQPAMSEESAALRMQIDSSASWFYWVAGLSLVNTVTAAVGSNWSFIIGLGIPQLLTAAANELRASLDVSALVIAILWALSFAISAFFAACGWFASRPSVVAFVAGTVLFALDSVIFVIAGDWIGVAFHALVLYFFWKGIVAAREYKRLAT